MFSSIILSICQQNCSLIEATKHTKAGKYFSRLSIDTNSIHLRCEYTVTNVHRESEHKNGRVLQSSCFSGSCKKGGKATPDSAYCSGAQNQSFPKHWVVVNLHGATAFLHTAEVLCITQCRYQSLVYSTVKPWPQNNDSQPQVNHHCIYNICSFMMNKRAKNLFHSFLSGHQRTGFPADPALLSFSRWWRWQLFLMQVSNTTETLGLQTGSLQA